ncbi:cytochrome c maturation protein CcmE [Emticicia sp. C21]|uniref:cytochrome c maturation protein CcmE domain-containing protein n=1 Tax=Emticicia sp. C21 TaxID=2302915 RepID=UPI000E34B08C|nr:cytochrome c maturation protein CcmE [Emticicia sp. C21]RFS18442.1 cytochrome c maturation protein CcmE [Emticicia sp. C21]
MKKSHIIALAVIAVAVGIIISTVGDASTYVGFSEAEELAKDGNNKSIHVVGSLKKDAQGNVVGMIYDPVADPNSFQFTMIDSLNREERVIYNQPKPQDLDKSEKVVVVGSMDIQNKVFRAEQILLKCPSKYNNNNLEAEESKPAVSMQNP